MLSEAIERIQTQTDSEEIENRNELLEILDGIVHFPKRTNVKDISFSDFISIIETVFVRRVPMQKTFTGTPYVLFKNDQHVLLNLLYTLIQNCKTGEAIENIEEYNSLFPFETHSNQALFVGTSKKLSEMRDVEKSYFASEPRMILENMMLEYSILTLFYDRKNEKSKFRDTFLNILIFCVCDAERPRISQKFCMREAIKLLMLSNCHKWFVPTILDMRKQFINFKFTDIIGRLKIDGKELFPRVEMKAKPGQYFYDNGEIDPSQPEAIELMEIMANSAKVLNSKDSFENVSEAIDFILSTDLLSKDKFMLKYRYTTTKIIQNEKTDGKTKILDQKTLRYL